MHRARYTWQRAYGLPLCRNIVSRTGLNARYPPTKLYRIMPDRDGGRERERRVERTQRTGCKRFSGHVATAKLLTSDWPLEETGLTAPPTLHCPISSRSIARPSIIDSYPPPLLFPVLFACPMARAGSFLVKKVIGQNDYLILIHLTRPETRV